MNLDEAAQKIKQRIVDEGARLQECRARLDPASAGCDATVSALRERTRRLTGRGFAELATALALGHWMHVPWMPQLTAVLLDADPNVAWLLGPTVDVLTLGPAADAARLAPVSIEWVEGSDDVRLVVRPAWESTDTSRCLVAQADGLVRIGGRDDPGALWRWGVSTEDGGTSFHSMRTLDDTTGLPAGQLQFTPDRGFCIETLTAETPLRTWSLKIRHPV